MESPHLPRLSHTNIVTVSHWEGFTTVSKYDTSPLRLFNTPRLLPAAFTSLQFHWSSPPPPSFVNTHHVNTVIIIAVNNVINSNAAITHVTINTTHHHHHHHQYRTQ
jgi:hypothetical protein